MPHDVVTLQQTERIWVVRLGPWKLVMSPGRSMDECMLFEITSDPRERIDLSRRYPGIVYDLLLRSGALAYEETPVGLPIAC